MPKFTMTSYRAFSLALLVAAAVCVSDQLRASEPEPPNVVIILADDLGYGDLSCYGSKTIPTPNIDAIAERGIKATSYYAGSPWCSSSRAAILTGCYPDRISVPGGLWGHMPVGLHPDEITLGNLFKSADYSTAYFGKWHLGDRPKFLPHVQGFDESAGIVWSHGGYAPRFEGGMFVAPGHAFHDGLTKEYTGRACQFIKRQAKEKFFVFLSHPMPHLPLACSEEFIGKSDAGLYGDVVVELDWSVGKIVDALESAGVRERTLIVFTSDNGPMWGRFQGQPLGSAGPLRGRKGGIHEGGERVPFVASYPRLTKSRVETDQVIAAIDVLPTLAELIGADPPENRIDGTSLLKLLNTAETTEPLRETYYYFGAKAVRHGDWKLIARPNGADELYNLSLDPSEQKNLADQEPKVLARLGDLLKQHREMLADERRLLGRAHDG